jgi:hypothetical protein
MDKDGDGLVDWREFFQQFSCHEVGYFDLRSASYRNWNFSDKLKLQMARVLEEEIHGLLELERFKSKLYTYPNYKLEHLFDAIDLDKKGYLTQSDIQAFLSDLVPDRVALGERRLGGSKSTKSGRILRRLDNNQDQTITFNEFCRGVRPQDLSMGDRRDVYDSIHYDSIGTKSGLLAGTGYDTVRTHKTETYVDPEFRTLPSATTKFKKVEVELNDLAIPRRGVGKRVTRNVERSRSPIYRSRSPTNLRDTVVRRSRSPV